MCTIIEGGDNNDTVLNLVPMTAVSRRSHSPKQAAVPGVAEVHDGGARPPVPRAEGQLELDHSG